MSKFNIDFSLIDYDSLIHEIGGYLDQFKSVSSKKDTYNFRCNICGDSKKNKIKKRGYIFKDKKNGGYYYKCFNCGDKRIPLITYTKIYFPDLYTRFIYNNILNQKKVLFDNNVQKESNEFHNIININEELLSLLIKWNKNNISKQYLYYRKIPINKRSELYFIDDLNILLEYINTNQIGCYKLLNYTSPRIVIPVYTRDRNKIIGFVCRSILKADPVRYYNIKISEEPLLLGLDKINTSKFIYIVEGYFDSLFLSNSIATNSVVNFNSAYQFCLDINQEPIFIFDNESHNKDIIKMMKRFIDMNERVVIFSSFPFEGKDLNSMIMKNNNINLEGELSKRIYQGLQAKLEYDKWLTEIKF